MEECINNWFQLAQEGSISWRTVADMCAGAYQVLVYQNVSSTILNDFAQRWEQANQEHEKSVLAAFDKNLLPRA